MTIEKPSIKKKLLDPITIYSILLFMNIIVLFILFFRFPFIEEYREIDGTITQIFWNGFFNRYDNTTLVFIESDTTEIYPKGASILFLTTIISILVCSVTQILTIILKTKMTRKQFLTIFIWPTFIISALMMTSVFTFVNWNYVVLPRIYNNIIARNLIPIRYGIFLSVLLLLIVIASAVILTKERKNS